MPPKAIPCSCYYRRFSAECADMGRPSDAHHLIEDVQILRGVAVLMTVGTHLFWLVTWGPATWLSTLQSYFSLRTGVDLFFVISGYVITRDIMRRFPSPEAKVQYWSEARKFWVRRIFRIWPTAWFWLMAILAFALFFNESGVFGSFRANFASVLSAIAQVANLRYWNLDANHTGIQGAMPALDVFWSLSLEEQFYLALPFLLFFFPKAFSRILLVVAIGLILTPRSWPGFGWYFRIDPVIMGVLLAVWRDSPVYQLFEPKFMAKSGIARVAFLIVMLTLIAGIGALDVAPIAQGLTTIFCTMLVFVATFDGQYVMPSRIIRSIFMWVGSRSYAIYVVHGIAYFLVRELWFRVGPYAVDWGLEYRTVCFWVAGGLIVVFAEFNFRCIETPLRKIGKTLTERSSKKEDIAGTMEPSPQQ
ncbi:acyltransferase family protein [Burkholderia ubonensis]|uniref:acyltransferase family protein n=1 Tax=Burkholderia ubonensis TaxID=101571 RepID=UPI0012FA47BE|nr:acyltransferase [Burkholderia ubonensis]